VSEVERFGWEDAPEAVAAALARWSGPSPIAEKNGRCFVAETETGRLEVRIPRVLPHGDPDEPLEAWLERASRPPGRQVVLLYQAGASALGIYDVGELIDHRTLRRYVVRGKGRAQPSYLKTKGKSRYGSRLRLRNARRLAEDMAETLRDWREDHGPFDQVFYSCPVRHWADFVQEDLPFDESVTLFKIPLDLNRPSHDEMLRAWRALSHGSWLVSA
jgi:hypothetical protein